MGGEGEGGREGGNESIVWSNCSFVDIKSSAAVGVVCVCVRGLRNTGDGLNNLSKWGLAQGANVPAVFGIPPPPPLCPHTPPQPNTDRHTKTLHNLPQS